MAAEVHYTAIVEIVKVTGAEEPTPNSRGYIPNKESKPKQSKEIAKVIVRATTIEKLKEKLKGHIDLVEEV